MLKAPFPYFGGKSAISSKVWLALGDCKHYIEPFFGSGAVLLCRPNYQPQHHIESVCDKDGFVANVWRALQFNPDEVAKWCDWPVNHVDLVARRRELLRNEDCLLKNLTENHEGYDSKIAGYWIWAASCWIGSGLTRPVAIPHISGSGQGVHSLGQIPHIADGGKSIHSLGQKSNIYDWFKKLQQRLRYVRVVCGDWARVCGGHWQTDEGVCGMFFDPPYGVKDRDTNIYHHDSVTAASDVLAWVRERGKDTKYRIVLAGYEEYSGLLSEGWRSESWSANGGYSNTGDGDNRHRETLYYSPGCCNFQKKLFAGV